MPRGFSFILRRPRPLLVGLFGVAMFLAWFGLWVRVLPIKPRVVIRAEERLYAPNFSPDGRIVAAMVYRDYHTYGPIRLWDVTTGQEVSRFVTDGRAISSGRPLFFPDGRHLIYQEWPKQVIRVIELGTGRERAAISVQNPKSKWTFLLPSPDGNTLAYSEEEAGRLCIRLWDLEAGVIRATLEGDLPGAFSPDGRILAVGDSFNDPAPITAGRIELWDTATGNRIRSIRGFPGYSGQLLFSPDGRLLAAHCDSDRRFGTYSGPDFKCLRVWEIESGQEVAALQDCWGPLFIPDRSIFAARCSFAKQGNKLKLWDTRTWDEIVTVSAGFGSECHGWSFPMAGDAGKLVVVQDSHRYEPDGFIQTVQEWLGLSQASEFKSRLAVRFFEPDGSQLAQLSLQNAAGNCFMSPDGKTIAFMIYEGAEPKEIHLYDVPPRRPVELYLLLSVLPTLLITGLLWWRLR